MQGGKLFWICLYLFCIFQMLGYEHVLLIHKHFFKILSHVLLWFPKMFHYHYQLWRGVKIQTYWIWTPSVRLEARQVVYQSSEVQKLRPFAYNGHSWLTIQYIFYLSLLNSSNFIWVVISFHASYIFFQNKFKPSLTQIVVPGWFKQSMGSRVVMWLTKSNEGCSQAPLEC